MQMAQVTGRKALRIGLVGVLMAGALGLTSCGKSKTDALPPPPRNPKQAATQLEQAFASSGSETVADVKQVSDAMRQGQYDKAVMSLQVVRSRGNLTLEQGVAVHGSIVAMEAQLIQAMGSGDPNAKRAYELLRAMKRQ
jgi:ABC-type phosphate transport system substrate-binding protein